MYEAVVDSVDVSVDTASSSWEQVDMPTATAKSPEGYSPK
jgi:hypothetical protein